MGFASGFAVGYGAAERGMARRKKSNAIEEIGTLGDDAEAVKGTGLKVGDDEGVVTGQGVDASGNAVSAEEAYRQAYARAGMEAPAIESTGDKFAARSGEGKDYGVYATEADAESGARKANYGLTRQRAAIYEKNELDDEARGLRRDAQQMRLQDQQMDLAVNADKRAAAGEARDATKFEWETAEQERKKAELAREEGLRKAMGAYTSGDWGTLGDLFTNIYGDNNAYQVAPDGKSFTVIDKASGKPIGTKPMPDAQGFYKALLRTDPKNWAALMQQEHTEGRDKVHDEQWSKTYGLQKQEADSSARYRRESLAQGNRPQWMPVQQADGTTTFYDARGGQRPADFRGAKQLTDLQKTQVAAYFKALENINTDDPVAVQKLQDSFGVGGLVSGSNALPPPLPPRGGQQTAGGQPAPAARPGGNYDMDKVRRKAALEAKYGRGNIPATEVFDNRDLFSPEELAAARQPRVLQRWTQ